jgi:hypothetical protein
MLTKQQIDKLKEQTPEKLIELLRQARDNREILSILKNLGHLPKNIDGALFLPFLESKNSEVRFWAVKNIAKLTKLEFLPQLAQIVESDRDSMVRREAVSAIGRLRDRTAIPFLLKFLEDRDPKVVLQAIRGLLIFNYNPLVKEQLRGLLNHPNETIQSTIMKEFGIESPTSNNGHPPAPHPTSPAFMRNAVVLGDVQDILKRNCSGV